MTSRSTTLHCWYVAHVASRLRTLDHAAKDGAGRAGQWMQVKQDVERLPGQRHVVGGGGGARIPLLPLPRPDAPQLRLESMSSQ